MIYSMGLGLLTDLYQLTMAYGYWKTGFCNRQAVFHLMFRRHPFGGGFTVACGLATALEYLSHFRFDRADLDYLSSLQGGSSDGGALFDVKFLDFLADLRMTCDIDAVPEGTLVFAHEPLLRVKGSLLQAQIIESALLNSINFQSLIATKAARLAIAAKGDPVIEFGLRRSQGFDGALSASRAAYIGGCSATSNVLAARWFGIPVQGTHAHSWVMCFDDEQAAFEAYAQALPNHCLFLVDTYDTLQGVRRAVTVGQRLRQQGHDLLGIRLDSGDLAYLSIEARRILDQGGFPKAVIVGSNDLDEQIIESLKEQGSQINVWGVGTKLVTAYDQPSLGCVYKLSALQGEDGFWQDCIKLSEQTAKTSTPGMLQVRRFLSESDGHALADAIFDMRHPMSEPCMIVDPLDSTRRKTISSAVPHEDLLVPVLRQGQAVYDLPSIHASRQRTQQQLAAFHSGVKRFVHPHEYPVGLEWSLHQRKTDLILKARGMQ